ncbi:hypothetical protein E4191_11090 [Paracoccus liaowanqingii]|uniref:Uncharacterized protein n=1 Tax=Paracoccus liaowanqingii TaxID=2560053 RepID=A0A4P7HLR4_9RHOB|nr:hypothetical protein [Paracoccus liaowanqingii]QBX35179.1 hypothetical protein E4191_11090 [Paracoccus liaowanqingii]
MTAPVTRPIFAEGQILQAAQLDQLAAIPRGRAERHNRLVHRPGIVNGLMLSPEPAEDSFGNAFSRVFLDPGLAIDGYGREILLTERTELSASRFRQSIGNTIAEETPYPVFVVSQYRAVTGAGGATDACGPGSAGGGVEEGFELRFGQPGDETQDQVAPAVSGKPSEEEGSSDWMVLVGFVTWSAAAQSFADVDAETAQRHRPSAGVNAATVAGDDAIVQLQPKGALLPGDTVLQVSQTANGPELCFGTFKGAGRPVDPLLKVNAAGDVTAKGALTGKRTGNSVQVESGIASDGTILPLPQGVTAQQVLEGKATVHVTVSPMIDPAYAPDPTRDFAALVQECRVDADRRVHCRIAWTSLPLGGGVGGMLTSGPGAVSYLVAVATSEGGTP